MKLPNCNFVVDYSENYKDFTENHLYNATYWLEIIYKNDQVLLEESLYYLVDLCIAANIYRKLISTEKCTLDAVADTMKKVLDKHPEPVKITNDTLNTRPWCIKGRW